MMAPISDANSANPGAGGAVLVSGASFAGLATAFWMIRLGYRVTVVEIAGGLRRGGTPVDVEGDTIEILGRMGLIGAVRGKALPPRLTQFKNAADVTIGEMAAQSHPDGEKYEIHRDDLLDILFAEIEERSDVRFGRSITQLSQSAEGVAVTFDDGSCGTFDLVFGCDGNRSSTRRLAFGDENDFAYFMGGYFAIKVVPDTSLVTADMTQIFSEPGVTALLNGYHDRVDVALSFRSNERIEYDHRDRARQRQMIHDHFDGLGWKVPSMLAHIDADDDFYFDQINQIRMPTWTKGRVALVGDAGYCVSPIAGKGGSLAIIGAARLAAAIARHRGDHAAAFRDYDASLRPFVEEVQDRAASTGMAMLFPSEQAELDERNERLQRGALEV